MVDTGNEKKYIDLIATMIMQSNKSDEEKTERIKSFLKNHIYCYENFCFDIYRLTTLPGTNVLTLDDSGISYVNLTEKDPQKKYYDVLVFNEYTPYCGDIIMHVDVALKHLDKLLHDEVKEWMFFKSIDTCG